MTTNSKLTTDATRKPLKILSLVQYVSEILSYWEVPHSSFDAPLPDRSQNIYANTGVSASPVEAPKNDLLNELGCSLASEPVDLEKIRSLAPTVVFVDFEGLDSESERGRREKELSEYVGSDLRLITLRARTLEGVYGAIEKVGEVVGKGSAAREMCNRLKAQIMDWSDSFYDRMKNKRVSVLSSVTPLRLAGRWIPDLVKGASCLPHYTAIGGGAKEIAWREIEEFRPDVIVVAPDGLTLEESVKTLRFLERYPTWETIPAVKRGEVIFCDGIGLYLPGPRMLSGVAQLISAVAGLESGYITERDSFYRLRWVELHRHKFL